MKKILLYIGIALAAIGCTTDDTVDITPDTNAVQFSTPNIITRVTSAGAWEGTEEVGISMSGDAVATNVKYKAKSSGTSTTFEVVTSGSEILYPRSGSVYFRAYYPYQAGITDTYTLNDISDQSAGIEQFDLLNAINKTGYNKDSGDNVPFTFNHALSKISIEIGMNDDMTTLSGLSVSLDKAVIKDIKYDLAEGAVDSYTTTTGAITLCTTVAQGNATATAEAIIVPGVDITGATVTFEVSSRTFTADFALEDIAASKIYKYEITLGAIEAEFDAPTISNWQISEMGDLSATDTEALGAGTETDPFLIYDETDMCAVGKGDHTKNSIYKGNWSLSSHYKLMNDVELTKAWSAIGTYTNGDTTTSFTGSFDGNNKSVKGISIDVEDSYQGLFGYILGATIKDLSVAGGVKSTVSLVGGIVGRAESNSIISNCSSSVVVEGSMSVGGIVGSIRNSSTVINCFNSGQVTSTEASNFANCGGVVGHSYDGSYIINCYNSATVISKVGYVGGVVGITYSSTITNCYSSGLVSTSATANIGGVVGCNDSGDGSSTITLCYYDKTEAESVGGAIGASSAAGADTTDAYGLTTSYMKSSSFLTLLNNGAYGLSSDDGIAACAWYTGASGYPEFDPSGAAPDTKEYDIAYDDGDDVYLIYTDKGMKAFADLVNKNSNSSGAYYLLKSGTRFSSTQNTAINGKLVNDIDISVVSGSSWTPIGDSSYNYAGKFDGDNKLISGLYINASSSYQGLFGYISGAEIKNLGVSGSVTNTGNFTAAAGVVGCSNASTISDCYNLCKVAGGVNYVGGVVGYNISSSETPSIVVNCYNLGDVSSTNSYLGGVVGYNRGNASVVNCYNQGDVSSTTSSLGGVVGYNSSNNGYYGSVINCYNSGAVGSSSSSSSSSIGGVVGYNASDCTVTNCYWDGDTSAAGTMTTKATKAVGQEYNANTTATKMTTTAMQAGSFVTALNNNAVSYNTSSPSITAHGWEVVEGSYPIFSGTTPTSTVPDIELVDGVYLIHTAAGLVAFSDIVNGVKNENAVAGAGVTFSETPVTDVCGTMTNSIDMSGETWSGIGSSEEYPYTGEFNGGSYTVTGLSATYGLVNYNSGTIINVGVSGVISGIDATRGGVVANNLSAGKVINCYNSASVTGTSEAVGGVVGVNYGVVNNCYSYGAVSGGESKGGVVGYNDTSGVISYCYYDTDENVGVNLVGYDDNSSNTTNSSGKTTAELQSETMLKILNNGAYYYNYDSPDTKACAWHTGPDKYPTFDHSATPTETIDIEFKSEVYYIYTVEGLQAFADLTNGVVNTVAVTKGGIEFSDSKLGSISGELTTSINLDNREWTPICKIAFYTGVFEGNGFEISGLNSDTGLFGYNDSGTIKNVIVSGSVIGSSYTGGVLAYNNGGLVINCCSNVTISGDNSSSSNGGIVGYNNAGSVVNCYNLGAVGGSGTNGGVVGYNSENGKVLNCYNSGAVSGGHTNGGVVGSNNGGTVTNGYFDNTVNSTLNAIDEDTVTTSITVSMTTTAMQHESLVKMLNNGAYDYNDGNLGTKACAWIHISHGYAVLDYDGTPTYTTPDISLVDEVYKINTAVGLNAFGYMVNGAVLNNVVTSGGVNFSTTAKTGIDGELTADIDLSTICSAELNANWSPIGNAYNNYNGEFDGNGYEVKNIYINVAGAKRGLFGWTETAAVIRNVGVSGTIVASNTSGSISYECGGVVAYNQGMIINCYNLANVTCDFNVGGIAGYNCTTGSVINCYNRGNITGSGDNVLLEDSTNKNIGGMVGQNQGKVLYGYSDGTVTGDDNVGGVVGYNVGDATISGCYYLEGSTTYCIGSSGYTGNSVAVSDDNGYYCSNSKKLQELLSEYAATYNGDGDPTYTAHSWKDVDGQPYPIIDYNN